MNYYKIYCNHNIKTYYLRTHLCDTIISEFQHQTQMKLALTPVIKIKIFLVDQLPYKPFPDPFPHFLNWKDNLNVEHFIKDLLFINFHQIYELVSMATKFFKVHGISEKEINI